MKLAKKIISVVIGSMIGLNAYAADLFVTVNSGNSVTPVADGDKIFMQKFALDQSFSAWAARCDKLDPDCSRRWKTAVEPILSKANR